MGATMGTSTRTIIGACLGTSFGTTIVTQCLGFHVIFATRIMFSLDVDDGIMDVAPKRSNFGKSSNKRSCSEKVANRKFCFVATTHMFYKPSSPKLKIKISVKVFNFFHVFSRFAFGLFLFFFKKVARRDVLTPTTGGMGPT